MNQATGDKLAVSWTSTLADGFNRALNALKGAVAIDSSKLRFDYKPGSQCCELVTAEPE